MTELIKQIRKILGNHWSSQIHVHITKDEVWLEIYETEVVIIIDLKKKEVYVDCEASHHCLNSDMLNELGQICRLIEENLDVIKELLT